MITTTKDIKHTTRRATALLNRWDEYPSIMIGDGFVFVAGPMTATTKPSWTPWELTPSATAQRAMELLCPQSGQPDILGAYLALGAYLDDQCQACGQPATERYEEDKVCHACLEILNHVGPPKPEWLPSFEELDAIEAMDNPIPGDEIPDFWDGPDDEGCDSILDVASTQATCGCGKRVLECNRPIIAQPGTQYVCGECASTQPG